MIRLKLSIPDRLKGKKLYREVWKDIEGYENLYQVSNMGRVRSLDKEIKTYNGGSYINKGKIINGSIAKSEGYLRVTLVKDGKSTIKKIHRLVAEAFIPNLDNKPCVDHINTIRTDNRVVNLRWVTYEENMNNPLTKKKISKINTGKGNPFYGKKHTEESLKKISESGKGRIPPNRKKIICIELNRVFDSIAEAGRELNIGSQNICKVLKGERKTAGGYHWKYVPD